MTVSDNTIQAEDLGDFFKDLGQKRLNASNQPSKKRYQKILEELCKLVLISVVHLHVENLRQLYHHFLE